MKFKYVASLSLVIFSSIFFSQVSHGEDLDQVLKDAKAALQNPVGPETQPQEKKTPVKPRVQEETRLKAATEASPANLDQTAPLQGPDASHILDIDLKAVSQEREPQDPRFNLFIEGGFYQSTPSFTLTKDDDNFQLAHSATLTGGNMALNTSWGLFHLAHDKALVRLLILGNIGLFSGSALVTRTGVINESETCDYLIAPISLGAGFSVDLFHSFNFSASYGPALILASQQGSGQVDTLSGAFSSDELQFGLGASFGKGWEAALDFFDNGLLNQNAQGQGLVLGLGYRISG